MNDDCILCGEEITGQYYFIGFDGPFCITCGTLLQKEIQSDESNTVRKET